jgi:hypothetical protein
MIIPHELLVWNLEAPVVCIGVDFDIDTRNQLSISGSMHDIDESYALDRRRADLF